MDEDKKRDVAIFRFGVIHDFVSGATLDHGEQERLLREKSRRKWAIPHSSKSRITRTTILRWIKAYRDSNGKLESLYPRNRSDRGISRGMDEDTTMALLRLRKELPKATVPFLIQEMNRRGLTSPGLKLNLSTMYRFLHRHQLMKPDVQPAPDRRKFEAELPNELWQSDAMHGPRVEVKAKMRKTYLLAFLDDHSRLIPHAQFYLSEGISAYLDALEQALAKRGLPRKLYLDNGPAFRSRRLEHVTASLGIALIHSSPYKPQGRGKIERFFRTVRDQFLPGFRGHDLIELNEALELWLNDVYHHRTHSATSQTPFDRFTSRMECLRPAPQKLKDHFRIHARRRVAKDRTVTLNGRLYEAPVSLIAKRIMLLYHENQPEQVEALYKNRSHGFLTPVDIHANARVKRNKDRGTELKPSDTSRIYESGKLWDIKKENR
jgi:transposase InsO family protein